MARGEPALINPEVIAWARKRSRIPKEAAAQKLNIPVERLLAIETGQETITLAQAREFAKFYRRALAVFFLPAPPDDIDVPTDFRRLPDGSLQEVPTDLIHAIREARMRQAAAIEIAEQLGTLDAHAIPNLTHTTPVTQFAATLREAIDYPLPDPLKAAGEDAVFRTLRHKVEDIGALVFTFSLDVKVFRGLSLYDTHLPVIAVNAKDTAGARSFSLIHELAHLALRHEGTCTMIGGDHIEVLCNAVAGEFLVPKQTLLTHPLIKDKPDTRWEPDEIRALARAFGVSLHVIARRLRDLSLMDDEAYRPYLHFPPPNKPAKREGGPSFWKVKKAQLGAPFITLVAEGYHRNVVSVRDLHELLGVPARKLELLIAEIR